MRLKAYDAGTLPLNHRAHRFIGSYRLPPISIPCHEFEPSTTKDPPSKKDIIKETQAAEGVTIITSAKQRSAIHDKMERLLLVWINEREMKRDKTSMPIIQEKAREIFEKLKEQTPGSSSKKLEFKATTGWFTKFKRRSGIKHVLMHELEVNEDDIEELIMRHEDELTTEELQEILNEEHQEAQRNVSPSEQEQGRRLQICRPPFITRIK
ncbi:tigger transposable element-derived protein 1-like protein [Trichonephila clavipes]|nr:tigger transposable element-derived protein 1-like protein [Trichonephila clavipes]